MANGVDLRLKSVQQAVVEHLVQVAEVPVVYGVAGNGSPVALMHGLAGSWRWWRRNVPAFGEKHTVYLIDLPGFGSMRRYRGSFSLAKAPEWLGELLATLGVARVAVIGHSMGGAIALALAARHPEIVERLVLAAPAVGLPYRSVPSSILPFTAAATRVGRQFLPTLAWDAVRAGPWSVLRSARELFALELDEAIAAVRCPTLLVWGARDALVPVESGERAGGGYAACASARDPRCRTCRYVGCRGRVQSRGAAVPGGRLLKRVWTTAGGYRMFARVADRAAGPAVVLVHGLGVSSRYMIPLAKALAGDFRVYAPDLPGFGRSEMPKRALNVEELASALAAWTEARRLGSALVVGNSMGCQVMAELAAVAPSFMTGAVLLGPTMDRTARSALGHVAGLGMDVVREPLSLLPIEAFDYVGNGPLRTIQTFRYALRHDMLGRVAEVRCPAVVMRGARDPIASRAWVRELAARMPDAQWDEVDGAAHALNYNSPERVAGVVRTLDRRLRSGPT